MKAIMSRIWRAIIEFDLIEADDRILIGLSGGKDSLLLTYALAHMRRHSARPFSLGAFTIDTRFDAAFPRQELSLFCENLGIPFDSLPVDIPNAISAAKSPDACAICAFFRRGALNRMARERGYNKVALAHHHDDAVETFMMSLFYSGRLKTFLPKTPQERSGVTIIRPLVYFRESEIIQTVDRLGLKPLKNPCPYNGHSKRQEIKEMLRDYEAKDPEYYRRFSAAMRGGTNAELWPPEPDRYALKGKYLEFSGRRTAEKPVPASLESSQNELRESEAAIRALLEGLPDTLLRVDRVGMILDFKTSRDRMSATPARLLTGNLISEAYPETLATKISSALEQAFLTESAQLFEHEMVINQKILHQEIRVTRISANEAIVILRDFTERRQLEKSLQYFNLRDSLTGLFNRSYWDEKISAAAQFDETSVGILVFDIDGMGLINDSLGRERGNRLLVAMATAFRVVIPLEATIARIGDDEFAALLTGITLAELEDLAGKLLHEIEQSSLEDVHLRFGVSFGYAVGVPAHAGIMELFQTAKTNLHRNKLANSQSGREEIFKTLQAALSTRDFVSHQHAARLWALGRSLAQSAGLPARRLHALKRLTQFHDIGKVGISDSLIFKQTSLTVEEMRQMQLHVEIGHRIAQSVPVLFSIAELILRHHEWWNGHGYPLALRGEEIPLECRIFAVIDAYDAMTNDRPDRKALSGKEAAAELRRCAGSQFDPDLVNKFIALIGSDA